LAMFVLSSICCGVYACQRKMIHLRINIFSVHRVTYSCTWFVLKIKFDIIYIAGLCDNVSWHIWMRLAHAWCYISFGRRYLAEAAPSSVRRVQLSDIYLVLLSNALYLIRT
jgi:hypothetical protein